MHKQRIVLVIAAAAGAVSALMPWQTFMYISQSGMDVGQAWIVLALFGGALLLTFLGNWATPLAGAPRALAALIGAGGLGFGIWKLIQVGRGTLGVGGELGDAQGDAPVIADAMKSVFDPGMGLYAMIGAGAVVAIAAVYRGRRSTLLPRGPFG